MRLGTARRIGQRTRQLGLGTSIVLVHERETPHVIAECNSLCARKCIEGRQVAGTQGAYDVLAQGNGLELEIGREYNADHRVRAPFFALL